MAQNNKDIEEIKSLWQNVKKNITTSNIKLIRAMDALDKYLY